MAEAVKGKASIARKAVLCSSAPQSATTLGSFRCDTTTRTCAYICKISANFCTCAC